MTTDPGSPGPLHDERTPGEVSAIGTRPDIAHPSIRILYDYWDGIRPAPDRLPGRQHLDPLDIPALLPDIWLVDVVREADTVRFRYRLQGTRFARMTGFSGRGRWVDEVSPDFPGSVTEQAFLRCIERGQSDWRRGRSVLRHVERSAERERIFLPLARDGVMPDMLLAMTIFYDLSGMAIQSR